MSDDLVQRLREYAIHMDAWGKEANHDADIVDEAADRIEKLEAEVKRLEPQIKMARQLAYRPRPEYPPEIGVPHLKED